MTWIVVNSVYVCVVGGGCKGLESEGHMAERSIGNKLGLYTYYLELQLKIPGVVMGNDSFGSQL